MRAESYWWAEEAAFDMRALMFGWGALEVAVKQRIELLARIDLETKPGPAPLELHIPIVTTGKVLRFKIPKLARRQRAEQDRRARGRRKRGTR